MISCRFSAWDRLVWSRYDWRMKLDVLSVDGVYIVCVSGVRLVMLWCVWSVCNCSFRYSAPR